jgi:hypothetical protein
MARPNLGEGAAIPRLGVRRRFVRHHGPEGAGREGAGIMGMLGLMLQGTRSGSLASLARWDP